MNLRIIDEYDNILLEVLDIREYEVPGHDCLYVEGKRHKVVSIFKNYEKDKFPQLFGAPETNYGEAWIIYTVKEYV